MEALRTMAAEVLHDSLLSVAFDSFGDELEAERFPQTNDSLEKGKIGRAAVDPGGEAAVDLHDVDRQPPEICERRIAGTEVVERELDAAILQGVELLLGALAARDEDAL